MSFSQYNEDLEVLQFYNYKTNGFFVDIGAGQGIRNSNTYLFEYTYNWSGICIETNNSDFRLLCENRPNSICRNIVVDSVTYDASFIEMDLSGNQIVNIIPHSTINDLLDINNVPFIIDYVSFQPQMPTSGILADPSNNSAFEILNAVDFSKYTFGLISMSIQYLSSSQRTQIRELFISNGYEYIKTAEMTDWYKHIPLSTTP